MAESATVLFSLAVEDPLAADLLDGVLAVAEAHGVSLRWGTCNGGLLVLAFDGPISQAEIVGILESKARSKSQASLHESARLGVCADSFSEAMR